MGNAVLESYFLESLWYKLTPRVEAGKKCLVGVIDLSLIK
jgi:hypothetical protein